MDKAQERDWTPFGPAYSVLVQDVDQPEPTLPEVLFGPTMPAGPKHEVSHDGKTWFLAAWDDGFARWHRVDGVIDRRPTACAAEPNSPAVTPKRRVSTNGRDFVDYDSLIDADPFDAYKWRTMLNADGSEYSWRPGANAVEREQAWALHLHGEKEVAYKMRSRAVYLGTLATERLEAMIASEKADPVARVAPSCAPMLFGGIVRLR